MEALQMGGDAAYVWPAYGITLLVLIINIWAGRRRHRQALERARQSAGTERVRKQPKVRQLQ